MGDDAEWAADGSDRLLVQTYSDPPDEAEDAGDVLGESEVEVEDAEID
jgi:hypothetical protein